MTSTFTSFILLISALTAVVPGQQQEAPTIVVAPQDQKVADNGVASFYCRATGHPAPQVHWRRANRRIPVNKHRFMIVDVDSSSSVLRIDPVRLAERREEGAYECRAENGVGTPAVASGRLEIYSLADGGVPEGYPRIIDSPTLKVVEKGLSTVMTCVATGSPPPEIQWLKDFVPINRSDPRLTVLPSGSLQITDTTESDEAKYECTAENDIGIAYSYSANLYVKVRRAQPHFSIPPESIEVMPGGSANLSCVAIGSPMPYVKWRLGPDHEITEDPAPIGRNTLALVNITQSANYTCVASSDMGIIEAHAEVKVKALPRPPIELVVGQVGPTSAIISWKSGNIEPIESYTLRYRRRAGPRDSASDEVREVVGLEHVLSNLLPHSTYGIEVFAINNIGSSLPATTEFTTAEDVPGSAPLNVRARPVSASTVVIQWEEPEFPNGIIKGYKVFYTLFPDEPISSWSLHAVDNSQLTTIGTLTTNQTYSVSVLAFTSIGDGLPSSPIQVKTQLGVPEQPRNLRGEAVSSSSIQLEWNAPDMSAVDSIESYELYFNDSMRRQNVHITISPPTNSYLLEDLTPNAIYHIHVSARSARGEGASTPAIAVRTMEAPPSAPPQSVNGETSDSTSIHVSWQPPPPDQHNGVIAGYRVLYAEAASGSIPNADLAAKASVPAIETSYIVRGLHKYALYNVWVAAYTSAGDGPKSDVIVVQTAEDVPGEPRKVKLEAINSTAVVVQWRPPADRELNGVIRGYQVLYLKLDDREEGVGETRVYDVNDANILEAVIGGLEPQVHYQFQVAAYTRRGDGERSRPRKIRTKGAILGPPRNLQLTLSQEDPPVVQASWHAPRNVTTQILGYRVLYGIHGMELTEDRLLEADKYSFTSTFLDRGVEYEFRVSAKNSVDFGDPAIETILTPEGVPAGAPLNVTSSNRTTSSVQLHWDPPAPRHRNGEIVLYEIMYRYDGSYINEWTTNTSDTQTVVGGLDSGKDYQFQIRAYTSRGSGPWSDQHHVRTLSQNEIPAPSNVRIKRLSATEMEISWDAPMMPSSLTIAGYTVFYTMHSSHVSSNVESWPTVETGPGTSVIIGKLDPRTVYAAAVRAKSSDARLGTISRMTVDNRVESEDARVQNFRHVSPTSRTVSLVWSAPKRNDVSRYKIEYAGFKHYRDEAGTVVSLSDTKGDKMVAKEHHNETVVNLAPKTPYDIHISARFSDGTWGPTSSIRTETLPEAPPPMKQPLFNRRNGDSSITMRVFLASEKHGPITHYIVVVVTTEMADQRPPDNFTLTELQESGPGRPAWIAARYNAIMLPREINIGDGQNPGTGEYLNRHLSRSQSYKMFVRSYVTDSLFTSSPYSSSFSVDLMEVDIVSVAPSTSGMELVWIVAPVCIAVVLILLLVLIIVYVRKRSSKKERPVAATKVLLPPGELLSYPHDPVELRRLNFQTPGMASHPPIPIAQIADYIADLRANDGEGFSREYESIEPGQPFTWDASSAEVNKAKNRYANVVAYDHSRVELQPLEGVPGSDYINANFLDGYCHPRAYIATQGPLIETFGDFWRMIWEQQATTIVMMTKLEERNRIKCDQYWPNRGTEIYGMVQVTIVDVLELATFTVRTFHISLGNYMDKREVRQFQFTAWPDHGVPEHPLPLLQFIRRVKSLTPPDNVPLVVHCSAGVGRTGTYVVIDAMLDRLQHERTLDVYGHVTCLRAQRNYMVQTEDQYVFIYEALLDATESGNTEVPADSLYVHVQHLTTLYTSNDPMQTAVTGMELEFKKLASIKVEPSKFGSANYPVNKHKNRLVNILPFEMTRVNLQPIRGVEGSEYINASFIDGYRCRKAYIATQGPLMETTEDFWRMLWEHNCSIIVMMTRQKEMGVEKCYQYWPEERSARYQYFVVDPVAQYNMPLYILREFKVTDARDGQSRTIRQFQFTDWPEQGVPSSGDGFIEFIGHVQKTKEQFGQDGPITVHCSMGVGRTGVFIALSIVLERMRYEGVVDMFQTVRMLRTQRPGMVQTEDQYAFCYRAALEYLGSFDHYAS